jgi:hypothetical protein
VSLEPRQARVEGLETGDTIGDVGATRLDKVWKLGGGVRAMPGVAPARDLAGIPERDVEPTEVDQEAQMLDVRLAILAIGIVPS